jgi:hypothetical protein
MKSIKLLHSLIFLMIFQCVSAQDEMVEDKDQSPDFLLESQFYPRLSTGVFEPNLKARIVFSDAHVLRSNLTFQYNSDKHEILEQNGNGVGSVESIDQSYQITLGYEYLFKNDRITPYLGFELITGWGKNEEYGSRTDSILFVSDLNYSSKTPVTQIGVGFFSGVDVSIVEGLYIGTELGIQYLSTKNARGEFRVMDASSTTSADVTTSIPENQHKALGVSGVGVIRIGWKF